jgi:hypothetical protein
LLLLAPVSCRRETVVVGYACGRPPPLPVVANKPWNCGDGCFIDENLAGLPGGPERLFERPDDPAPDAQPVIVYPLAASMHPLNLGGLTVQWRRGGEAQAYFRLRVIAAETSPERGYTFYIPCRHPPDIPSPSPPAPEECVYPLTRAAWTAIASENADGAVDLTIDGSDPAGATVARSAPVRIAFAPSSVQGGIYFLSGDRQGILRATLGAGAAQPFLSPLVAARFSCVGCHSVSHDGRVMAFSAQKTNYLYDGSLAALSVDAPEPLLLAPPLVGNGGDAATLALSRDGRQVLVSFGTNTDAGHLAVREIATGRELARLDPAALRGGGFYFPDWSPDGQAIVGTVGPPGAHPWSVAGGSIVVLPYGGGRFGEARTVVPQDDRAGLFHYYPTWSPDGAWIAFVSAPLPGESYGNAQSRLRLISRDGGRVYDLDNASQGAGKTSTYPRFAPVMQDQCEVLYLTFNSKMDYGFLKNSARPKVGSPPPQLWMSALDLRALPSGDPSRAPVWLPFQEAQATNLLGAWTQQVVCRAQADCGPAAEAFCDTAQGVCVPKSL